MDKRYFHGIRTSAAEGLRHHAKADLNWLGLFHLEKAFRELFCYPDTSMTRSNDFSDRAKYYIQCAIPRTIAKVRDNQLRSPFRARSFLYEKLRYNDNSNNEVRCLLYLSS
jgi:transcription initiation factor TFIID subunit 2